MPVQIGAKPEASFKDPIGVLTDCHRRVERFLDVLFTIASQHNGSPLNGGPRSSFENALRYFRDAAPKHTADEEDSLFPRLRAMPEAAEILSRVDGLESDHARAGVAHLGVERLGSQWLDRATLDAADAAQLTMLLSELKKLYRDHIAVEELEVFPEAARLIASGALREIGDEMAQRRGIGITKA